MWLTPVANGKKSLIIKVLIIFFGHRWEVELTYRYIFAFKFTLRSQQPDLLPLFANCVNDTGGKFAAGIVDFGVKFATCINNTNESGGQICCWCR